MFVVFQQLLPGDSDYDEKKSNEFPKTTNPYRKRGYLKPWSCSSFYNTVEECVDFLKWAKDWDDKNRTFLGSDTQLVIDEENPINSYYIVHSKGVCLVDEGKEFREKLFIKQFTDDQALENIRQKIIGKIKNIVDQRGYEIIETRRNCAACTSHIPSVDFEHFPVEIEIREKDVKPYHSHHIFVYYLDEKLETTCVKLLFERRQMQLITVAGTTTSWYENLPTTRRHYTTSDENIEKVVKIIEKKL